MIGPSNKLARRIIAFLGLSLGLGFTVWLVVHVSLRSVLQSVSQVGWGVLIVVAVRAAMIATNGVAWRQLLKNFTRVPTRIFVLARWIREAVDVLLPTASIGGGLAGARILTFWRLSGAVAVAAALADLLLQTAAQALFALVGALLLARVVDPNIIVPASIMGIIATVIALGGFYIVQRYGGARLIDRTIVALASRMQTDAQSVEPGLQMAMDTIWRGGRSNVGISLLLHTCAWAIGTLEVWFTLHFMNWPTTLEHAVILESLGASISSAAFFIPASWGVQEGGYILIGHMLGVPIQFALSLSLVKRIPDFMLGVPGLLAWHGLETRRLLLERP